MRYFNKIKRMTLVVLAMLTTSVVWAVAPSAVYQAYDDLYLQSVLTYSEGGIKFSYGDAPAGWTVETRKTVVDGYSFPNYVSGSDNPTPNDGAIPRSGIYVVFEPQYSGTITVVVQNASATKKAYIVESVPQNLVNGTVMIDGVETAWTAGTPFDAATNYTGPVSFSVKAGREYYFYISGSKMRFQGFLYYPDVITFADSKVKEICVANWDTNGDGELSFFEADCVTSIGTAFKNNTEITSFSELQYFTKLTSIGDKGFSGCTNLEKIKIPQSVTSLGESAFFLCTNLSTISIPNSVVSIGSYAFDRCESLSSISIPNSVVSIGIHAFQNCTSLSSIIIPKSVTTIEYDAFAACSNLTTVVLGNSTPILIKLNTFSNRANATLYVPAGSKAAYESAAVWSEFKEIIELENITFADSNAKEICVAHWDTNCDGELSTLEAAAVTKIGDAFRNVEIASFNEFQYFTGVENINVKGFYFSRNVNNDRLTSIILPKNLKSLSGNSFFNTSLTSIEIPASVNSIAEAAFNNNLVLESINVAADNAVYDSRNNCNAIIETETGKLVAGCIKTIIPNDVTIIGASAFRNLKTLTSITIPKSVTSIEMDAFNGCSNLTTVVLGNSTPIALESSTVFSNRANATLYVPAGSKAAYESAAVWSEFKEIIELENISFADSNAKEICVAHWDSNGDGELSYMEAAAVNDLGETFKDNAAIISFEELQHFTGLTVISKNAFLNCSSLRRVVIPETVDSLAPHAFETCWRLQALHIPASVTKMNDAAIRNLSGLTQLTVDADNPKYDSRNNCNAIIETETNTLFTGCHITTIPEDVVAIAPKAFHSSSALVAITIPKNIKSIGENAFNLCQNLVSVTVKQNTPIELTNAKTFSNRANATLYVPAGSKTAYMSAPVWNEFKEIVEIKNHFVLNDTTMRVGQSILFPVALSNESEVTAFQCDIYLPEGISLLTKKGKYDITLDEERVNDQSVSSALQEDGSIRVAVASLTSSTFYGNDGNLLYLNLRADENISGDKVIEIRNISISETDGTRHDLEDVTAVIEVMKYIPADVNNNGTVAIDDVVLTINYLIGDIADNFLFAAGDMNGDNIIKIDDVVMVINALLGDYTPAGVLASSNMTGETMDIRESENGFTMGLRHASEYVAMQYDLILPEGVSLRDIRVTTGSNHTATFRAMGEGEVRVIITSLTNEAFDTAELMEVALTAETDAEITITEAYVVTRTGRLVQVEDAVATLPLGSATGIDAIGAEMNDADLYDLNGRIIRKNTHDKGVYLMNGKKMMVK